MALNSFFFQGRHFTEAEFIVYTVYLVFVFVSFATNLFSDLKSHGDESEEQKEMLRGSEKEPLLIDAVAQSRRELEKEDIQTVTVIGFPFGFQDTASKVAETKKQSSRELMSWIWFGLKQPTIQE